MSFGYAQFDIEKRLKRMEEQRIEGARIRCPKCNDIVYDANGGGYEDHPVSYWGDDTHEVWCAECDHSFEVEEIVERTFRVLESTADADEP